MALKLEKVIGHRGCVTRAPENTLEGFHVAANHGVKCVETDAKLTKDNVVVLHHDNTVDRTTNGLGKVSEMTFAELRELDAGSSFDNRFKGAQIPTLEEAIKVIKQRGMSLNLEIKPCPGREAITAEIALDILSCHWDEPDKLLITSFETACLETAMDKHSNWNRALFVGKKSPEKLRELVDKFQVATLNMNGIGLTYERVEELKTYGKLIIAHSINDADRARELWSWGVDGLTTDAPNILQDALTNTL